VITINKEFKWDMAHMLAGHQGPCKNIHGHSYKMQVEIARLDNNLINKDSSSTGMIIDFKDLKNIVQEELIAPFDHAFMYWANSNDQLEHEIAKLLKANQRKIIEVDFRPTAENIADYAFNLLEKRFAELEIKIVSLKVWETPSSYAVVKGDI